MRGGNNEWDIVFVYFVFYQIYIIHLFDVGKGMFNHAITVVISEHRGSLGAPWVHSGGFGNMT